VRRHAGSGIARTSGGRHKGHGAAYQGFRRLALWPRRRASQVQKNAVFGAYLALMARRVPTLRQAVAGGRLACAGGPVRILGQKDGSVASACRSLPVCVVLFVSFYLCRFICAVLFLLACLCCPRPCASLSALISFWPRARTGRQRRKERLVRAFFTGLGAAPLVLK